MFNNENLDIIQEDKKNKKIVKKQPLPEIKNNKKAHSNGSALFPLIIVVILLATGIGGYFTISSKANSGTTYLNESDRDPRSSHTISAAGDSGAVPRKLQEHESDNSITNNNNAPYTSAETVSTYADGFNVSLSRTISNNLKESVFKQFSDLPDADLFESACKDDSIEEYCKQRMEDGTIVTYIKCEIENEYDKEALEKGLENYQDIPADSFYAGAIVKGNGYVLYLVFEKK